MKTYTNFINLCKMSQERLKDHVAIQLANIYPEVISEDGFVFARGTFPVLLVAHLDTVHKALPQAIVYNEEKQSISSPQGIGGDDRCGVYMILEIIKKFNCSVLFCEDEEIGCIGADKFTMTELAKNLEFNYIIEFDRKGNRDAVFYDCDNPDFEAFITEEFFKTAYGTLSDISILAPYLGCAAVNLSCGYYSAHMTSEYVVMPEMEKVIEEACNILARTTENDKFEYIESAYSRNNWYDKYDGFDEWDNYKNESYLIEYTNEVEDICYYSTFARSEAEALGNFMIDRPTRCYDDITYICPSKYLNY